MLSFVIEGIIVFLPALVGNVAVYLVSRLVGQSVPLDSGVSTKTGRLIGDSRTLLGAITFALVGAMVGMLQGRTFEGLYLGLGAQFGTLVNSLIKRKLKIPCGTSVTVLDSTDFILGASAFYILRFPLSLSQFGGGLLGSAIIHILTNYCFRARFDRITSRKVCS